VIADSSNRRVGCVVVQARPVSELRRDWRLIEDAGFHTLWVWDHLMAYPKMGVLLEAWTTLAAMAMSTSRIRIGPLVANITYRNPAVFAKEAISVDHLSGGRLELGIGAAGTRTDDALVSGVDEWPTRERVERFGEFVEMVSRLTSGESDSYGGRHYRSDRFARGPWPVQPRIPLTIAAHGMKTLRIAARHADTWNVSAGFGRNFDDLIGFLHENNARLDEFAAAAGREPGSIRRSLLIGASGAFEWWKSAGALDEFVGRVGDAGTRDLVFAYPPPAGVDKSTFLELLAPLL
jgi:alkanesulfonate monooxygenase SsuD/methylene tetrahydromethanopterin reductase-like flavin-dependent oxidoreductase (luciferase family)